MIPIRDEIIEDCHSRSTSQSSSPWFHLSLELIISIVISVTITLLRFIKTLLPAPPRDLKGDVVLVSTKNLFRKEKKKEKERFSKLQIHNWNKKKKHKKNINAKFNSSFISKFDSQIQIITFIQTNFWFFKFKKVEQIELKTR